MISKVPPRVVFVGGVPRSGTTLVQRIICSHSDVAGGPEFRFVPRVARLYSDMVAAFRSGSLGEWTTWETLSAA